MRVKINNSIILCKEVVHYPKNSPYLIIRSVDDDKYLIQFRHKFIAKAFYNEIFFTGYSDLNTADNITKLN